MRKKDIKKLINEMIIDEDIIFCTQDSEHRTDRVTRLSNTGYSVYSQGQGWCDQVPETGDFKQAVKWIWDQRPKATY